MGLSDETFRRVLGIERDLEEDGSRGKRFENKLACEYSGCSFEKVRLGLAIVKGQKYCSRNPGIEGCGAYQYLSGLAE